MHKRGRRWVFISQRLLQGIHHNAVIVGQAIGDVDLLNELPVEAEIMTAAPLLGMVAIDSTAPCTLPTGKTPEGTAAYCGWRVMLKSCASHVFGA